jgi:DNA-directed RNA polymerase specialized sigma24 family protein
VPPEVDGEYIAFYSPEVNAQARRAFLLLGSAAAAYDVVADVFVKVYRRWDRIGVHDGRGGLFAPDDGGD